MFEVAQKPRSFSRNFITVLDTPLTGTAVAQEWASAVPTTRADVPENRPPDNSRIAFWGRGPRRCEPPNRQSEIAMNLLNRLMREEEGQDIIEYVLIAAAISVIASPIVPQIGTYVTNAWNDVSTKTSTLPGNS